MSNSNLNVVRVDSQKDVEIVTNGVYEAPQTEHAAPACSCCGVSRLSKWIPPAYREELVHILKLAGPVVIIIIMMMIVFYYYYIFSFCSVRKGDII